MTPVDRKVIEGRLEAGDRVAVIAADFGCAAVTIRRVRAAMWMARRQVSDSELRLCFAERVQVEARIGLGESDAQIGRALDRNRSTIGREIKRCGRRQNYRAVKAQRQADKLARRPKVRKLASHEQLLERVEALLRKRHSPQQIAAWLRRKYPDDVGMHISHETIYQSLYVQARGLLNRELTACLRTGRTHRKPHGTKEARGRIVGMVSIAERPPEADDRAVPGHWEGDLILGKGNQSAVLTLVERQTRYVLLAKLEDQTSVHVTDQLAERISHLPAHLLKTLTWDQGREMATHKRFSDRTGISVYFCDPHSPWQRGSNENTNGLLRQYMPKGTDLSVHSQDDLDEFAEELNRRPRMKLDWWNPAERLAVLLGEEVHPFPA